MNDKIQELAVRTQQAAKLVEAHGLNPNRQGAEMRSRSKFLNSEIERLSMELAKAPTTTQFTRAIEDEFPLHPTSGSRIAQLRSATIKIDGLLAGESDEGRAKALSEHASRLEARIREEEALESEVKRVASAEYSQDVSGKQKRNYRSLFGAPTASRDWRSLSEMGLAILSGRSDPRLSRAAHAGNISVGVDGGFLVSPEFAVELFDLAIEQSVVLSRADVGSLRNGSRIVAMFNETDREDGSLYGFSAQWLNEGASLNLQKPQFTQRVLKARKLGILTAATSELLQDAIESGNAFEVALARAIAHSVDRALLIAGNGTTQPPSVLNSASKITVAKESGQTSGIVYKNLTKMMARLLPEFESSAVWVASPSCKPALLETSIVLIEDVSAAHVPVLKQEGGKWYLLGREIIWSEHCKQMNTEGDIMLCNFNAYAVGISKDITIDRSSHVYFSSDEVAFRAIMRLDAGEKLASPITVSNGETLSWCITLQTRS